MKFSQALYCALYLKSSILYHFVIYVIVLVLFLESVVKTAVVLILQDTKEKKYLPVKVAIGF